ncbi:hypothetical protein AB0N05_33635 [Nocardia sp. NPDC051030]|uniref:hypothetical protein n=1 Tax=Nocardia sp. NPDC051030 TaxID=3155162 RepID=UPI0034331404
MIKIVARNAGALAAVAACTLVAGCGLTDDQVGIPDTDSPKPRATTSAPAQASSTVNAQPVPATTSAAPAVNVTIGEVPGNPNAATALQPWARDLLAGDLEALVRKCWTIDPDNARDMYADQDGILAALAQPGIDGQFAVIWKGPAQTVSVKRTEITSGYACPRVAAAGTTIGFNDADARYTVQRYLSRWIGKPVNANDTEGKYPLVCAGSTLANNPGKLTGTTAFAASQMTSEKISRSDVEVSVPVTNSSGVSQPTTFSLTVGSEGYCVNDIQ